MNKLVGERELKLGASSFVLRPEFEALIAIEDRLKTDTHVLLAKALTGTSSYGGLSLKETVAVLYECAARGGNRTLPSFEEFGREVMSRNYRKQLILCLDLLSTAFDNGDRVEKKTEPEPPKSTECGSTTTASQ